MPFRWKECMLYFLLFYICWELAITWFDGHSLFTRNPFTTKNLIHTITAFLSFLLYPLSVAYWLSRFIPRRPLIAFGIILLCIPFIIAFRYTLQEIIGPAVWGFGNYFKGVKWKYYLQDNLYFAVLFTGYGIAYFFIRYTQHTARIEAERTLSVKEAELSFLKSQINPHFLFNSLHSIYILVYQKDEKALSAVEKLSSLLRYALYEQKDKVPLESETGHLKEFIQLQQLRISTAASIDLDLEQIDGALPISPLLLISFAENAFKHGDFADPAAPLTITAHTQQNTLSYTVSNKIACGNKPAEGGIGLHNLRRRLELLYPNRHTLTSTATEQHFSITLQVDL
jgi:hypothetical protein